MKFTYEIPDGLEFSEDTPEYAVAREPGGSEVAVVRRDAEGRTQILANQAGWIYLAKVCLEMAHSVTADRGFHIHRGGRFDFKLESTSEQVMLAQVSSSIESEIIDSRT